MSDIPTNSRFHLSPGRFCAGQGVYACERRTRRTGRSTRLPGFFHVLTCGSLGRAVARLPALIAGANFLGRGWQDRHRLGLAACLHPLLGLLGKRRFGFYQAERSP